MKLVSLYLRNFRNFKEAQVDFGEKINLICGNNAQGKTNLLEALLLLSTGRSFRTQHLSELILDGAPFFFIEAKIILQSGIEQTLRLSFDGQAKRAEYNATSFPSFQPLLGVLPSTLFAPQDLDLVMGSPSCRRRFLNLHLAQSDPLYVHHLLRFWRALKQRNSLLKHTSYEGIEVFEEEMALSAAYLYKKRDALLQELNEALFSASRLFTSETLQLRYFPSQAQDSYLLQLKKNRTRERQLGMTLTGPHRDDFLLLLDQKLARLYASEGQKRTAIAALRLAEWHRLAKQVEILPLFGVDDFEMHLDADRQRLFKNALYDLGQVFITTPQIECEWPGAKRLIIHSGAIKN